MALGIETKISLQKAINYYEAISLIEDEDLRPDSTGSVRLNITNKLSAKTIYKLGRFKDVLAPISKRLDETKRKLRDDHVVERTEQGKVLKVDMVTYTQAVESFIAGEEETITIPEFKMSDFIDKDKFIVPLKFISLFGDLIKEDE